MTGSHTYGGCLPCYNFTTGTENEQLAFQYQFSVSTGHTQLTNVYNGNMTKYFVTRITTDGRSANDFNSKAFPLFKDSHVQNVKAYTDADKTFCQAQFLPEMNDIHYTYST